MLFITSAAVYSLGKKCVINKVIASLGSRVWSETNFSEQWLVKCWKMQCLVMEKRKTDSPCNLDFFLNTKRWELLTSPLSSLYSFKKKENRTCFLVHKQKSFPSPCPIFSYLKFRMNVSLVRRWGSSERKVCKAQNKSLFEGQTGWAISSKGIQWAQSSKAAYGWWFLRRQKWGPDAERRNYEIRRMRNHLQISKWNGPKVMSSLLKK